MTIAEEMIATFQDTEIGTILTSAEIKHRVSTRFARNRSSIIPSDYCYNRINNGIAYENQPHLFKYCQDKTYVYLGPEYPFTGKIFHKPKGYSEICVGELINGVLQKNCRKLITSATIVKNQKN